MSSIRLANRVSPKRATEFINSLEASAEKHVGACRLLKERHDNKKVIREAPIESFLHFPSLLDKLSVRNLLNFPDKNFRKGESLVNEILSSEELAYETHYRLNSQR